MLPTVISARATLPSAAQACPKTVTFKFRISVPAAGTYYYRYVRSDGGRSGTIHKMSFAAAGEEAAFAAAGAGARPSEQLLASRASSKGVGAALCMRPYPTVRGGPEGPGKARIS